MRSHTLSSQNFNFTSVCNMLQVGIYCINLSVETNSQNMKEHFFKSNNIFVACDFVLGKQTKIGK